MLKKIQNTEVFGSKFSSRTLTIAGDISEYFSSNANLNSFSSKPFDRTVTNYLYISIQLANTADQARLEGMQLTNS